MLNNERVEETRIRETGRKNRGGGRAEDIGSFLKPQYTYNTSVQLRNKVH